MVAHIHARAHTHTHTREPSRFRKPSIAASCHEKRWEARTPGARVPRKPNTPAFLLFVPTPQCCASRIGTNHFSSPHHTCATLHTRTHTHPHTAVCVCMCVPWCIQGLGGFVCMAPRGRLGARARAPRHSQRQATHNRRKQTYRQNPVLGHVHGRAHTRTHGGGYDDAVSARVCLSACLRVSRPALANVGGGVGGAPPPPRATVQETCCTRTHAWCVLCHKPPNTRAPLRGGCLTTPSHAFQRWHAHTAHPRTYTRAHTHAPTYAPTRRAHGSTHTTCHRSAVVHTA
jgi:hypothetical protein